MKTPAGLVYKVKVKTKSSHPKVEVTGPGELSVRVRAAPERGQANKEVCQLLAAYFGRPLKEVAIVAGTTSPIKLVRIGQKESALKPGGDR